MHWTVAVCRERMSIVPSIRFTSLTIFSVKWHCTVRGRTLELPKKANN